MWLICLFLLLPFGYLLFKRYAQRWLFGVMVFIFFLAYGFIGIQQQLHEANYTFPTEEVVYKTIITQKPERKERSLLCRATVREVYDSMEPSSVNRKVLLYFSLDSAANEIKAGDVLLLSTRLALPELNNNPEEFDYPRYLLHKGISATGFISAGKWKIINHQPSTTLRSRAQECRDNLVNIYRALGFEGEQLAILSALTVGYKEELSADVREAFSVAGVSHVLAVSGLHVGFIFLLLSALLRLFPQRNRLLLLLWAGVAVALLWVFAFLSGLSPSVVRSVSMFTLFVIAKVSLARTLTMNSLLMAAVGMLLYNPSWLFDVGFQLSFLAVAGIVLINPLLYGRFTIKNRFFDYCWNLISMSVAAQLVTAPLVAFYFSYFSIYFLLANLLVIPLVTLIVYVALLMLVLTPLFTIQLLVAKINLLLLGWLATIVRWVENLPIASIDNIWLSRVEIFGFYFLLLLFLIYIKSKQPRLLLVCMAGTFCLLSFRYWNTLENKPRKSIVFYNIRNCPAVHCVLPGSESWVALADTNSHAKTFLKQTAKYRNRLRLAEPTFVHADYNDSSFQRRDDFLLFGKKKCCFVYDNRWRYKETDRKLHIDYLYLCKGYTGKVEELLCVFNVKQLILDASLAEWRRAKFEEECEQLGVETLSLANGTSIVYL
nr:ComEC/Rec2 family competence protein [Bacteroides sp. 214]